MQLSVHCWLSARCRRLQERAVEKKYTTIAEVAADIVDLIGVRITVSRTVTV
jgi:hypothetical protein